MKPIDLQHYKKILFLGDSITYLAHYVNYMDTYLTTHFNESKPMLINLGLSSETASGLSEAHHPFLRPCIFQRLEPTLEKIQPDLVIACYGMNDGIYHPPSDERLDAYQKGMRQLAKIVEQKGCDLVCLTPPPFDAQMIDPTCLQDAYGDDYGFMKPYEGYDQVLQDYGKWLMSEPLGLGTIDIYSDVAAYIDAKRLEDPHYVSGDGIHVCSMGHFLFTKALLKQLFNISLERVPEYVEYPEQNVLYKLIEYKNYLISDTLLEDIGHGNEALVLQSVGIENLQSKVEAVQIQINELLLQEQPCEAIETITFKGYKGYQFYSKGRECILIEPKVPTKMRHWVWRAEFFDAFSYADMALLEAGWHLAYCNLSDMYGNPQSVELMHDFYTKVVKDFNLNSQVDLFGFSRGGLYTMHYATQYPETLRSIYLDAPVLDLCSWPGSLGKGIGSSLDWQQALWQYALDEKDAKTYFKSKALEAMNDLVNTQIPIILVAGDADEVVPYEENGEKLVHLCKAQERVITVIVKPHIRHHPHSLEDPSPIVTFIQSIEQISN